MAVYPFVTVDVFTDRRFGGNPLAVFPDARGLTAEQMQALTREFNLSETTFVLPPDDASNTARVRIFNPSFEMPFAGHPNVGTGFVLAGLGRDTDGMLRFEEIAGLVEAQVERDGSSQVSNVTIAAPQPLSLGFEPPLEMIAACAGIEPSDVVTTSHPPLVASTGNPFIFAEITSSALAKATPDFAAFRRLEAAHPDLKGSVHLYVNDGQGVRTRMFAPLAGVVEDPATGSANVTLGALLLSLGGQQEGRWDMVQGVEMGRPSLLRVTARREADGIRATVGGGCVPVLRGEAIV